MRTKASWLFEVIVTVALGLTFAGAPLAQTTSKVDVRNFEVISVDGNKLVVRDERGTQELTVPDDFRFTVDGKKMSVSELKAGMKGTATVTTTTTVVPVVVTDIREAVVLSAGPQTMTVRDADGVRKRFTQDQLDQRGLQIIKDGRVIRVGEVKEGDVLTAAIVSKGPPTIVTDKEVQATLAASKAAPAPEKVAAATPAPPTPAMAPVAAPQPSATPPASPPAESSGLGLTWYVVIALLLAVVVFVIVRRRKQV